MSYRDRIVQDKQICGGRPVFKGTRVPLSVVLSHLAAEDSTEAILQQFPSLSLEDVRAAIAFAASSAGEDLLAPQLPPALAGKVA